ncbi:unnamed protein product, partial [Rotaria sp. Silwood2]
MFEQRVLCHQLPKSFDYMITGTDQKLFENKSNKIIQELKRQRLHDELEKCEIKIQDYEYLYQQAMNTFESKLLHTNSSYQKGHVDMIKMLLKAYLNHHKNRLIRTIRYKEFRLHIKLLSQYRRRSLSKQQRIDVYLQIITDVPKLTLNRVQLDYLSSN